MNALRMILDLARRLAADRRGASAVEYGIIVGCLMLVIFAALSQVGFGLQNVFDHLSVELNHRTE